MEVTEGQEPRGLSLCHRLLSGAVKSLSPVVTERDRLAP